MNKFGLLILSFVLLASPASCLAKVKKYPLVEIATNFGNMYVWLYDDTPKHKENFLKLARDTFYHKTCFHKVIKDFMIQGGDPYSKDDKMVDQWGQGGPGYTVEAEISATHFHKKGVLAAARLSDQLNPSRASSGSQFYIVQGTKFNDQSLDYIEQQIRTATRNPDFKFSDEVRNIYKEVGGAPQLDMQYTVFGEVINGIEVIDKIAAVKTGTLDKPIENITMEVKVLDLSAKQIKKKYGFIVPGSNLK